MLGKILEIASDYKRNRTGHPQNIHSKNMKENKLKEVLECIQTAPTACWRRLKALISFSNKYGRRLAYKMRKDKLNGK